MKPIKEDGSFVDSHNQTILGFGEVRKAAGVSKEDDVLTSYVVMGVTLVATLLKAVSVSKLEAEAS